MPANYTVIYSHPSGATATFIYENGELSALAKGLDAEQFWVFKQVKALLLRNEEDDLDLASRMMAEHGFAVHVMRPLPDLLAPVVPTAPSALPLEEDDGVRYRSLPQLEVIAPRHIVDEIHWREGEGRPETPPPHRAPPVPVPARAAPLPPAPQWEPSAPPPRPVDEIHWREGNGH
jgi:hypothetical protein